MISFGIDLGNHPEAVGNIDRISIHSWVGGRFTEIIPILEEGCVFVHFVPCFNS